jgi:hypothetical protein
LILPIPLGTAGARKQGLGFDLSAKPENNFRKPNGKCFKKLSLEGNMAL